MMGNYVHEFSNGSHSYAIPDDITIEQDYIFYISVEIEENGVQYLPQNGFHLVVGCTPTL